MRSVVIWIKPNEVQPYVDKFKISFRKSDVIFNAGDPDFDSWHNSGLVLTIVESEDIIFANNFEKCWRYILYYPGTNRSAWVEL